MNIFICKIIILPSCHKISLSPLYFCSVLTTRFFRYAIVQSSTITLQNNSLVFLDYEDEDSNLG